jgi:hypothetical protein
VPILQAHQRLIEWGFGVLVDSLAKVTGEGRVMFVKFILLLVAIIFATVVCLIPLRLIWDPTVDRIKAAITIR